MHELTLTESRWLQMKLTSTNFALNLRQFERRDERQQKIAKKRKKGVAKIIVSEERGEKNKV